MSKIKNPKFRVSGDCPELTKRQRLHLETAMSLYKESGRISVRGMMNRLGLYSTSSACKALQTLVGKGRLRRVPNGNVGHYFPAEESGGVFELVAVLRNAEKTGQPIPKWLSEHSHCWAVVK